MAEIQHSYQKTVNELDIGYLLGKSIFHLSSGEKQKVAIASVKTAGVQTYVLDEPSANLDGIGTEQLRQSLAALKADGHTIIVSEHKLHYLKNLCDRVLVLEQGAITADLSGDDFRAQPAAWFEERGLRQIDLDAIRPTPIHYATSKNSSIQAEALSFAYPGSKALWDGVSFKFHAKDIVGIVGGNGVGKSTLIRVLMGLHKPKSGKVYINGKYASKQKRQKQSFYVMQDVDYQLFAPTVLEEMLTEHERVPVEVQNAKDILAAFGLSDFLHVHPSQLSGGQKQRISIALALMSNANFIYLDEPTSGLDARNMRKAQQAIRQLADAGRCVFVITHDYEFATDTFTSLLVLSSQKVIRFDTDSYRPERLKEYFTL